MRIGVDAAFLQPEARYTGMGVYSRQLTLALAECEPAPTLILLGYGPRPADLPAQLHWHSLAGLPLGKLRPWLSHQSALPLAARQLGLDLLHVHGVNLRLSQPGVPGWTPCPLVVTLHDVIPLVYYGRQGPALPWRLRVGYRLALLACRRAAAIITVSTTARQDILRHLALPAQRVHAIYNGLSFAPPAPAEVERVLARLGIPHPYLLYAGSFEPRKNLIGTVTAYRLASARWPLPPLVALVERSSGHRPATVAAITASGVAERVHLVDSLTDAELQCLYSAAELVLYPSFYEGFGFVPLQALACGRPVIAGRTGALPEILGESVHYVDPAQPAAIAQAIVDLVSQPALAAALAARGPEQAARFRWSDTAQHTLAVYESIIRHRARHAAPLSVS